MEAGMTSLHWAAGGGHLKLIGDLLDAGAKALPRASCCASCFGYTHSTVLSRLTGLIEQVDVLSTDRAETPLHVAAAAGQCEALRALLKAGANVDALSLPDS